MSGNGTVGAVGGRTGWVRGVVTWSRPRLAPHALGGKEVEKRQVEVGKKERKKERKKEGKKERKKLRPWA